MRLMVCDLERIECGQVVTGQHAIISIRDPERGRAKIAPEPGLVAVLHTAFHDTVPADWPVVPPDVQIFSRREARRVWSFVLQHAAGVETIVVHCHYGKSRSPAVAAALARYFGLDWERYFDVFVPNEHVFQMMVDAMPDRDRGAEHGR